MILVLLWEVVGDNVSAASPTGPAGDLRAVLARTIKSRIGRHRPVNDQNTLILRADALQTRLEEIAALDGPLESQASFVGLDHFQRQAAQDIRVMRLTVLLAGGNAPPVSEELLQAADDLTQTLKSLTPSERE